ncbi:diguanylate cyclase/phosphodiesterase (GGDEF & EAL domains) with PAS/PAC sensor(s) [hydrothermal vent metagenome]|uniref:Diguanylate cyclase/phosphodiesterase (GGDEF & EAL domains) with PAS/PAC sensor(S) n=1 Tax=hydrothermal vent metagenome TaxID=652676 RepID=A0A3B1A530_9ZZZZ
MRLLDFSSFKVKYLFILVILVLVIILTIAISENRIQSTANLLTNSIAQRLEVSEIVETLHLDLAKANRAVDLYMISPNKDSRDIMNKSFTSIRSYLSKLKNHYWITTNLLPHSIIDFDKLIQNLEREISQLLKIRTNANEMYPAFTIANHTMLNANKSIITLLSSAILEKINEKKIGSKQYLLLISLRDQWRRLINDYRVYLINRLGSLFEKDLPNQENNIKINYTQVKLLINKLTNQKTDSPIGLATEVLIENISTLSKQWYSDYKKVLKINTSTNWRTDIPVLTNKIYPMFKQANYDLEYISRKLHENSKMDIEIQKKSMSSVSYYLLTLAVFVTSLIILATLFLYRNILHPIEILSENLKLEAQGKPTEKITNIKTTEMKRIIDSFNEMQYQVHSRQIALEHMAMHDALTSLPNRALLMDRLNHAILNSKRNNTSIALLLLDLDRFKEINDTLGHAAGDILLCSVAERLKNCLRDSDTVARLGGDEFAIVLPNISDSGVNHITKKLVSTLDKVYHIEEHNLYVRMSIGIANFPIHGEDSSSLMQHADIAMYQSKRTNTNITTYDPEKDIQNIEKLSLLTDLKTALINNEMLLHYLPISSLETMKIIGFEALIRWQHPIYGMIQPNNFISIAEQTGIIKNISRWVIKQAIAQCKIWQNLGEDIYVTINLSVWDLQDPSLEAYIKSVLSEYSLPANKLVLEITESAMMADSERAKQVLIKLHDMGLDITIDDYGTGFSSMAYLKQLPVDTLKIDKSFVTNMDTDENNETIVRSSIELAHNLGLLVLAEGVESNRIKDLLLELKCDKIQGYVVNKAITKESATKLLKQGKDNISYLKPK